MAARDPGPTKPARAGIRNDTGSAGAADGADHAFGARHVGAAVATAEGRDDGRSARPSVFGPSRGSRAIRCWERRFVGPGAGEDFGNSPPGPDHNQAGRGTGLWLDRTYDITASAYDGALGEKGAQKRCRTRRGRGGLLSR